MRMTAAGARLLVRCGIMLGITSAGHIQTRFFLPTLRTTSSVVRAAFEEAIVNKPENHTFAGDFQVQRPMTAIGG